jgi:hypothetical protein
LSGKYEKRIINRKAIKMEREDLKKSSHLLRKPSAFVPVAMSLLALAMVLGHALIAGISHEADEGTLAHIFQILLVAQLPIVVFFAIRWIPRRSTQAVVVLAIQALAGLAAIAAVFWLT